jgi:OOP family OmpA-OmpF porin
MNHKHKMRVLALALLGPLACASASAQDPSYFYGGLSLGSSRGNFDEARIAGNVAGAGTTVTNVSRVGRGSAYRILGGYQFNRYLGLEASYFDLGKFGFAGTTTPAGTLNGTIKAVGASMDVVGTLPLSESFSAIARVGAQWARTRDTFSTTGAATLSNANPSHRGTNADYGVGLQFAFSPSLLMRAEAESYRINDGTGQRGSANVLSVSLIMPFGATGK